MTESPVEICTHPNGGLYHTKDLMICEILERLYERGYVSSGKDERIEELLKDLRREARVR